MPRPRHRLLTLAVAGAVGVTAGLWAWPRWRTHHAITTITADAAPRRAAAWAWLEAEDRSGRPRLEPWRRSIEDRLADAAPAAVLDGGLALRRVDSWGWSETDRRLVERDLQLRAAGDDPADHVLALDALATAPFDLELDSIVEPAGRLQEAGDAPTRAAALDHALAWAGRERVARLESLRSANPRRLDLALSWAPAPPPPTPESITDENIARREAALVRVAAGRDDAASLLAAAGEDAVADVGPYLLRLSRDPRATRRLEHLAEAGSTAARFALLARDPGRDAERSARMANDPSAPLSTRRIAAWRWPDVPADTVRALLARDLADEAGHVAAAALLAERRLPAAEAREQAERWIRSFDDDEKRAGAVLAALLGTHRDLLGRAYELEDQPKVRTTQRVALWALGRAIGPGDPVEFAHRVVHEREGEFDPDVAACMLRAGRRQALALLTSQPTPRRAPVQMRAWLIERFAPGWHTEAGRPIGGSPRAVRLHFDRLDVLRVLTERRMRFDAKHGWFVETDT